MKKTLLFLICLCCLFPFLAKAADSDVIATLNGQSITEGEVMPGIQGQLLKVQSDLYEIKRRAVDQMIDNKLVEQEAKKQGLTLDKLIEKLKKKAGKATEEDAQTYYNTQKAGFKNKTFDDVKEKLIQDMTTKKQQEAINTFIDGLRAKAKITINIQRPKVNVTVDDDPSKGDINAPIVIIEFSEFQCPFCKRVRGTLNQIMTTYGNKVRYVFRDNPLPFHNQAKPAANAAECADEQGKYWEYNTALWDIQGQQTPDKLKELGVKLGLDTTKFNACVDSNKYFSEIAADQADAAKAGMSGTPAYSINGVFLSGAQPFDSFKQIIDEELAKKGL